MKKILTALLLPMLTLISCSSDDNDYKPADVLTLHIEAQETEGFVNKPIYFSLKDNKDRYGITDANIFNLANKEILVRNTFIPTVAGTYQFQAKGNNSGILYKESEIVTITITEPTKKEITVKNISYQANSATLEINRTNSKDVNDNTIIIDKLVKLNNTYYNEYTLKVNNMGQYFIDNSIEITFLVANKSVEHNNGVITNYGQRAYPTALTQFILTEVISYSTPSFRITNFDQVRESNLLMFYKIGTPKDNSTSQVISNSYFEFSLNDMGIDYAGDLEFIE
ncbi:MULTISPECIES: hypothetical protein [Myroides]|uniref:hypothetical protein n=1 Tax=Myroides TaxID=76831 RepID=UPI00057C86F8|nr:hypothetical protein [Myroides sp. A21]AJA70259.1 hypothetical protein MYRA21_3162 [Myroides sp. A21]